MQLVRTLTQNRLSRFFRNSFELAPVLIFVSASAIAEPNLDAATAVSGAETSGACSPVVISVRVVTLNCPGVPEDTLKELVNQLNVAQVGAQEAQERADEFSKKYFELVEYLTTNIGLMSPAERTEAQQALQDGQLNLAEKRLSTALARIRKVREEHRAQSAELMRQLTEQGLSSGGVIHTKYIWPAGSKIRVCFLNGSEHFRTFVADVASTWTLYGNIEFDFGHSLGGVPRSCSEDSNGDIRITTIESSNYSYLGTSALNIKEPRPTLSISERILRAKPDTVARNVVLHEFGHALALFHTNLHPDYCVEEIDWDYVYDYYGRLGWTRERAESSLVGSEAMRSNLTFGVYDRNSIMQNHFPSEIYVDGEKSRCYGKANGLQITDRLAVFVTYPYETD